MASTPQPTFQEVTTRFSGPFTMWQEEPAQASLDWPTGELCGGWSLEVGVIVMFVRNKKLNFYFILQDAYEKMESGDILGSSRCYTHSGWDLHVTADWVDGHHRAIELIGSHVDNENAVEWNEAWELAAR